MDGLIVFTVGIIATFVGGSSDTVKWALAGYGTAAACIAYGVFS